jgi:hypothetical protein
LENATVGVGGAPKPINDRVRPFEWNVDTRGVDRLGKGTGPGTAKFDISVMVEGVRDATVIVGEGGNTNSVWDGVDVTAAISEELFDPLRRRLFRRCSGGGTSFRDSARFRTGGSV